jgi:hypothetical protein
MTFLNIGSPPGHQPSHNPLPAEGALPYPATCDPSLHYLLLFKATLAIRFTRCLGLLGSPSLAARCDHPNHHWGLCDERFQHGQAARPHASWSQSRWRIGT